MTNDEYLQTQSQIALLAGLAKDLPLEEFLDRIEHTESTAPIFDPTLWIKGEKRLEAVKALAHGALALKRAYAKAAPVLEASNG